MKWLKTRKYRIWVSLAAGLAAAFLGSAAPEGAEPLRTVKKESRQVCGWWGTMYPKFCFFKGEKGKLKISFWLAKAFDW